VQQWAIMRRFVPMAMRFSGEGSVLPAGENKKGLPAEAGNPLISY